MIARRAVAYVRHHEKDARDEQELAIGRWAARENVAIASCCIDVGVDGTTPIAERPGLIAAYRAVVAHGAEVLVAANAECFTRDELVGWLIEQAALTHGAVIATTDGSRPPTRREAVVEQRAQSFTRGTIDLARAYERVTFRARVRAALAEKKARGERVGTVPYGYRVGADGVHLELDDAEQAVIASIRQLSSEGLSQRAIVARLAAGGVAGRTGAPLRQTQIAKILRSAS